MIRLIATGLAAAVAAGVAVVSTLDDVAVPSRPVMSQDHAVSEPSSIDTGCWNNGTYDLLVEDPSELGPGYVFDTEDAALDAWGLRSEEEAARLRAQRRSMGDQSASASRRHDEEGAMRQSEVRQSLARDERGSSSQLARWVARDAEGDLIAVVMLESVDGGWYVTDDRIRIPDDVCHALLGEGSSRETA